MFPLTKGVNCWSRVSNERRGRGVSTGTAYLAILQVWDNVVAGLAPVDDVVAVPGVSTQGADVGTAIEAFADFLGAEGQARLEPLEERLGWSHPVAAAEALAGVGESDRVVGSFDYIVGCLRFQWLGICCLRYGTLR